MKLKLSSYSCDQVIAGLCHEHLRAPKRPPLILSRYIPWVPRQSSYRTVPEVSFVKQTRVHVTPRQTPSCSLPSVCLPSRRVALWGSLILLPVRDLIILLARLASLLILTNNPQTTSPLIANQTNSSSCIHNGYSQRVSHRGFFLARDIPSLRSKANISFHSPGLCWRQSSTPCGFSTPSETMIAFLFGTLFPVSPSQ